MKFLSISLVFVVIFLAQINSLSSIISSRERDEVITYLQSFGYLPETKNMTRISHKQLHHALKRLQVRWIYFWTFNWNFSYRNDSFLLDQQSYWSDANNRWQSFKIDKKTTLRCSRWHSHSQTKKKIHIVERKMAQKPCHLEVKT